MPMPEVSDPPVSENEKPSEPAVEVFAVYGAEPEIQAYAMAKYSRSALSMKESLQRDQQPARRAVSQHLLLPVRTPLHRRPRAHCAGHRAPLHSRRHRGGRRAALGRPGALHPLSELQEERLLHARLRRRCDAAASFYRETVDALFAEYESLSDGMFRYLAEHHAQARRR